jgi:hypothetical protein
MTISYPGVTDASNLLQVYGDCVYIDSGTNAPAFTPASYFVPLKTLAEWKAFKTNLPPHLTLSGGCPPLLNIRGPFGMVNITAPARSGTVVAIPFGNGQTAHMQ